MVRLLPILAALAAVTTPAQAARTVPEGFYGLTYTGSIADAPSETQARTWGLMARNGAESVRTPFPWARAQARKGAPFDFSTIDPHVRNAVEHGLPPLPVITEIPRWARAREDDWWPRRPRTLAAFATALVRRYGSGGSFWVENPAVPERPVRYWQILNEPGRSEHYAPLLRAAHRAIKDADSQAKVVLAGLTGTEGGAPWDVLRYQYRHGRIRRWFDVAALHIYTGKPANVVEGAKLFRAEMRRHGDGRKPLWITEFGITASKGRTDAPRSQRTLRTTDAGMARFVTDAYRLLAENRRRRDLRVGRAYWHTWASSYATGGGIFEFAGLNEFADGELTARPALSAYRDSARRHEGCRKTTTADCR